MDEELVCTLSDWLMMFEIVAAFFVSMIMVDKVLLPFVFMKFPSQFSQFKSDKEKFP